MERHLGPFGVLMQNVLQGFLSVGFAEGSGLSYHGLLPHHTSAMVVECSEACRSIC